MRTFIIARNRKETAKTTDIITIPKIGEFFRLPNKILRNLYSVALKYDSKMNVPRYAKVKKSPYLRKVNNLQYLHNVVL